MNLVQKKKKKKKKNPSRVVGHIWAGARQNLQNHVRHAKTQSSLRIRAVWSESSLGALVETKDTTLPHVVSEDSYQTA